MVMTVMMRERGGETVKTKLKAIDRTLFFLALASSSVFAESSRVDAASARRAADERAQLAARAWEDAEDAKRVYESALGMHGRAFAVAERARASFAAAAAGIEWQ